jgi:CheY-like chemotaxis protein
MTAHNGELWAKSSGVPGEGCVFGLDLKIASLEAWMDTPLNSHSTIESLDTPLHVQTMSTHEQNLHLSDMHALVVDDSSVTRKLFTLHLRELGIVNVTQACNGMEAVRAVEERLQEDSEEALFDIIFIDCNMPVMGGNEATSKIRELGFSGPIVTVTGDGLPEDVREIMSCGSSQVLVKPVNTSAIATAISGM